jgi:hypothetical protein
LGEIVLVVLGILIALQINNWNQHQKNLRAEQQLLKDLNQEFQLNQNLLEKKLKEVKEGVEVHKAHLDKLLSGEYTYENLVSFQFDIIKGAGTSDPAYGVINSLIASGNIKLIRNDSLKYELTSWKDKMANLLENERFHLENIFKYSDYSNERVPKNANLKFSDLPQEEIEALFLNMGKDIRYRNFVVDNSSYLEHQVKPELEEVTTSCKKIIQLISKEMDQN